jgi:hypothetical protein
MQSRWHGRLALGPTTRKIGFRQFHLIYQHLLHGLVSATGRVPAPFRASGVLMGVQPLRRPELHNSAPAFDREHLILKGHSREWCSAACTVKLGLSRKFALEANVLPCFPVAVLAGEAAWAAAGAAEYGTAYTEVNDKSGDAEDASHARLMRRSGKSCLPGGPSPSKSWARLFRLRASPRRRTAAG